MTWNQAKATAKGDETLRLLAWAIRKANMAEAPDRVAFCAFEDRCQELNITVPNKAYWGILLGVVLAAYYRTA